MLYHSSLHFDELAHHLLFIAVTHYVLWGRYFARPFAWLSVTELSTPFLNCRWRAASLPITLCAAWAPARRRRAIGGV